MLISGPLYLTVDLYFLDTLKTVCAINSTPQPELCRAPVPHFASV